VPNGRRRVCGLQDADRALHGISERVGHERVGAFFVEGELDPTTLRGREVDGLDVVGDAVVGVRRVEHRPDDVEGAPDARACVEDVQDDQLAALHRDRLVLVLQPVAVERDHVGLLRLHLGHVGGLAGLADVVLLLSDPQLAVDRRQVLRLDDEHADLPAPVCMSTGCVAQWYMNTPGCLATKR
jgi:hypothetical protein